jgi:hypothetical protein
MGDQQAVGLFSCVYGLVLSPNFFSASIPPDRKRSQQEHSDLCQAAGSRRSALRHFRGMGQQIELDKREHEFVVGLRRWKVGPE